MVALQAEPDCAFMTFAARQVTAVETDESDCSSLWDAEVSKDLRLILERQGHDHFDRAPLEEIVEENGKLRIKAV